MRGGFSFFLFHLIASPFPTLVFLNSLSLLSLSLSLLSNNDASLSAITRQLYPPSPLCHSMLSIMIFTARLPFHVLCRASGARQLRVYIPPYFAIATLFHTVIIAYHYYLQIRTTPSVSAMFSIYIPAFELVVEDISSQIPVPPRPFAIFVCCVYFF